MAFPTLGTSVRRIAMAATHPLLPTDYLDVFAPLNGSTLRARITDIQPETDQAVTVTLEPGRGWRGHQPGQFLRLGVDIDGVRHWRSYSITSSPRERAVRITIKRQGLVSEHLAARAHKGQVVSLDQAAGDFTLPADPPPKTLFVTAGSGITPVMGILRSQDLVDVTVLHSARSADQVLFGEELRKMPGVRFVEHHTAVAGRLRWTGLEEIVPDIAQRRTWVCGPNDLIDELNAVFADRGWATPVSERFRPSLTAVGEGGQVRFQRCDKQADAPGDRPLLEVAESAGVLLPSGCRMGICYGCVTPLTAGSVRDLRDGTITTADNEPVLIQTCINAAAGAAVLDA